MPINFTSNEEDKDYVVLRKPQLGLIHPTKSSGNISTHQFVPDDIVAFKERVFDEITERFFDNTTEFMVKYVTESGLIVEDRNGRMLQQIPLELMEIRYKRGDYRENHSSGWYSYIKHWRGLNDEEIK